MLRIGLKPKNERMLRLVNEIFESTKIIRRQPELKSGVWDFVVYGPENGERAVIREGFAKDLDFENSLMYDTCLNNHDDIFYLEEECLPIENFIMGKIPDELSGLELIHEEPFRSLKLVKERFSTSMENARKLVERNYKDRNIAIIETHNEAYWGISVLKYLNECDQYFPDPLALASKNKAMEMLSNEFGFNPHQSGNGHGGAIIN